MRPNECSLDLEQKDILLFTDSICFLEPLLNIFQRTCMRSQHQVKNRSVLCLGDIQNHSLIGDRADRLTLINERSASDIKIGRSVVRIQILTEVVTRNQ